MTQTAEQLVAETMRLTGAAPPALLADNAPALDPSVVEDDFYLTGLIGGKDVGKSTLVNALVGQSITQPSRIGAGTQHVIAYAHRDAAAALRSLLQTLVKDQFEIQTHTISELRRQVLLDLPDVDSQYIEHAQLTRRMLRHILFPLWVQSVEKYADARPQALLAAVSEGNDPQNFLFCLNKVDQLHTPDDAAGLRIDYGSRLSRLLKLPEAPRVFLICAERPAQLDLPELRQVLSRQRPEQLVAERGALAVQRRTSTLSHWLNQQRLGERTAMAKRSFRAAEELLSARLLAPLLEQTLPRLQSDPGQRLWLTEPALAARLARWPIVRVLHGALGPLLVMVRKNLQATAPLGASTAAAQLASLKLASTLQGSVAQLRQTDPPLVEQFAANPLWEALPAERAAAELAARFDAVAESQRAAAIQRVAGRTRTILLAPVRIALTIGAVLWFPVIQPILERITVTGIVPHWRDLAALIVPLLGASYLLHTALFVLIWIAALWAALCWQTQRTVARLMIRWADPSADLPLSYSAQARQWLDELLQPLQARQDELATLAQQVDQLNR